MTQGVDPPVVVTGHRGLASLSEALMEGAFVTVFPVSCFLIASFSTAGEITLLAC